MNSLYWFLLALVIVIGGLMVVSKALILAADLLDLFAKGLRSWSDKKEKKR